jgi:hypothetical protein
LARAEIYEGGARSDAVRGGGVGVQVVRHWVLRFDAVGPAHDEPIAARQECYFHPFRVTNSAHLKKGQGNAD